jgi:hypothetical protein
LCVSLLQHFLQLGSWSIFFPQKEGPWPAEHFPQHHPTLSTLSTAYDLMKSRPQQIHRCFIIRHPVIHKKVGNVAEQMPPRGERNVAVAVNNKCCWEQTVLIPV